MDTKFGFEFELQTGAQELASWLYNQESEYIGYDGLHRYHCECDDCQDDTFLFRAQTDSSCAGEIISHPYIDINDAREAFEVLQEGCLEVDAEPGAAAGFHVHVDVRQHANRYYEPTNDHLPNAYFQFGRWEEILLAFTAGRFRFNRGNNNAVLSSATGMFLNMPGRPWSYEESEVWDDELHQYVPNPRYTHRSNMWTPHEILTMVEDSPESMDLKRMLLMETHHWDRHINLHTHTRHVTWEFRLFNSTRAAWRMELWCELARAFMESDFIAKLTELDPTLANLVVALEAVGGNAASLAERQVHYVTTQNWERLPVLTSA